MKTKEIPLLLLILFTIAYSLFGEPSNKIWSGLYFSTNYLILLFLFRKLEYGFNKIMGISLCISLLIFIVLRYVFDFQYERYYTLIPFLVSCVWIYKRETK